MILLIGDSNFRETFKKHKTSFEVETGENVVFKQATTNESVKIALSWLEGQERPKVIIIGPNINEIAAKALKNQKKGRDELVKTVTTEYAEIICNQSKDDLTTVYILAQPFHREEPNWMESRLKLVLFYMQDYLKTNASWNTVVGSVIEIEPSDLQEDKVHLNDSGQEKLAFELTHYMKVGLKDVARLLGEDMDEDYVLESSQLANVQKTPAIRKKRIREDNEASPSNNTEKKIRQEGGGNDNVIILQKLDQVLQEMREHRKTTDDKIEVIEMAQKESDEKLESLASQSESDGQLFAAMKEEIDANENESLKAVVVVKKLVTEKEIPEEKKDLAKFLQEEGRNLANTLLGEGGENEVKFVFPLYVNTTKNTNKEDSKGTIPPFKIVFKKKEVGMLFREKGIAKSKAKDKGFEKTYFAHMQNSATRIRCMLMWGVVDGFKKQKKEAWVNMNMNKPNIQLKEGGKITTITFVAAMQDHAKLIDPKVINDAVKTAKWGFSGMLKRLFIAISD